MTTRPAWDRSTHPLVQAAPSDEPITQLVLRAQAGDDAAFEALVHALHHTLLVVVRRHIRNPDDADDILQEAWARIARHLAAMREPSRFRAWAARIARHCSIDFLRSHRAERLRSISTDGDLLSTIEDAALQPPDAALLASEASQQLRSALARLSAQDRALLDLREVHELPYTQLAGRLGITVGAAQVRVFRARRRLQHLLTLDIEQIGCAVTAGELHALTRGQTSPAQTEMLWRHVGACTHCEYRLRLLKRSGRRARNSNAA